MQKYCLSLRRFSSDKQAGNTSLTRQADIAKTIADKNGWILRDDWSITQEAVSAYKKHNFPALLALIDSVKNNVIPVGTVVICEAIDRLSRASLDEGREMLRQMNLAGLEICDNEGNHYAKEDLNKMDKVFVLCLKLVAANEYSTRLSGRVKAAYQDRLERVTSGEKLFVNKDKTARKDCPPWITSTGSEFILNDKAKTVKKIFGYYLGNLGVWAVCNKLIADNEVTMNGKSSKWHLSVVHRLLQDRRVLGEYPIKGEVIKGYYPAVISEETYLKTIAKLQANNSKRATGTGSTGNIRNIFSGILHCACGEKIKVAHGKKGSYCTCYANVFTPKSCEGKMVKYSIVEGALLTLLKLNPSQLFSDDNGNHVNSASQILRGRKVEIEKNITSYNDALADAILNKMLAVMPTIEKNLLGLQKQLAEVESQIILESAKTVASKGSVERLTDILESLYTITTDNEVRVKVRAWFVDNVNRITFNRITQILDIDLKNGNLISMDLCGNLKGIKSMTAMFGLSNQTAEAINQ